MATTAELQATLAAYKSARDDILAGRVTNVQIEGQSYTMLVLDDLEKQIDKYTRALGIDQTASGSTTHAPLGPRGRLGGMGY